MQPIDFDEKGYSCEPIEIYLNEDWKTKPEDEWTEDDYKAFEYQEKCRIRHEMMDIGLDIY